LVTKKLTLDCTKDLQVRDKSRYSSRYSYSPQAIT